MPEIPLSVRRRSARRESFARRSGGTFTTCRSSAARAGRPSRHRHPTELDRGQFNRAAQLAETMVADDRIEGVIQTRVDALLAAAGADAQLRRPEGTKRGRGCARRLGTALSPAEAQEAPAVVALPQGGPYELIWSLAEDRWDFRIKVWDSRWMWFDFTTRTYRLSTLDGVVEVTPAFAPALRR